MFFTLTVAVQDQNKVHIFDVGQVTYDEDGKVEYISLILPPGEATESVDESFGYCDLYEMSIP